MESVNDERLPLKHAIAIRNPCARSAEFQPILIISGRLYFTLRSEEGDPIVGQSYSWIVDKFEDGWIPHPDPEVDLCMFPLVMLLNLSQAQGKFFYIIYLEWNLIPTEEEIEDFVGMENIIMVGYPNGIWDKINNFPILRSGVAATHYRYDWNGRPEFLIDCACFPGSSGSPVLVSDVGQVHTKKNISIGANRIKLLGILYAGPQHRVDGKVEILPVATTGQVVATSLIPNNLGIVIKARKLKELEEIALNRPK